jgi:hypothetical protein
MVCTGLIPHPAVALIIAVVVGYHAPKLVRKVVTALR